MLGHFGKVKAESLHANVSKYDLGISNGDKDFCTQAHSAKHTSSVSILGYRCDCASVSKDTSKDRAQ